MFLSIGETAYALGVSPSSLRNWEKEGRFVPAYRTPGGHRRYAPVQIDAFIEIRTDTNKSVKSQRKAYAYARVSSCGQKQDLIRQKDRLEVFLKNRRQVFIILEDFGSGLNCKKPGFDNLLSDHFQKKISYLVLTCPSSKWQSQINLHKNRSMKTPRLTPQIANLFVSTCGI